LFEPLFLTGMRVGELRALQWETDIDFENNLIHINKTKDRFGSRSPIQIIQGQR